jgi:hypothetical protein
VVAQTSLRCRAAISCEEAARSEQDRKTILNIPDSGGAARQAHATSVAGR